MTSRSELKGGQILAHTSFLQRFHNIVDHHPDSPAIICTHQRADLYGFRNCKLNSAPLQGQSYLRWSYSTLSKAASALSRSLKAHGATQGMPFFVFCRNDVESLIAALAAYMMGLIHVAMTPGDATIANELQHMVDTVMGHGGRTGCVVLANTAAVAKGIDSELEMGSNTIKITTDGEHLDGWIPLNLLLEHRCEPSNPVSDVKEEVSVLFTSGSTSMPKACRIPVSSWIPVLEPSLSSGSTSTADTVIVTIPMFHAYGFIWTLMPLIRGASIVFAGSSFTPQETITAIQAERCTRAAMVPTMVHSLADVRGSIHKAQGSLAIVTFAGMPLTQETVDKCRECFGAIKVENFYGMTEGVFLSTGAVEDINTMTWEHRVSAGIPAHGTKIKICAPGERDALAKGVPGHVHFSGPSMVSGYINHPSEDFYEMDGEKWFMTGDQAVVCPDDRLYLVGRYKDMVIRGGENISPFKIELSLAQVPEFRALETQIVAAEDPIAGEIPIAVVKTHATDALTERIQNTVRSTCGVGSVPSQVVSLASFGLDEWPASPAGKIKKSKLRELVSKFRKSPTPEEKPSVENSSKLAHEIQSVWGRVLGIPASKLDTHASISHLADSIILLSGRDRIQKATNRRVPLPEWLACGTIADQIALLQRAPLSQDEGNRVLGKREGPPEAGDMVHSESDNDTFLATKAAVEETLAPYTLTWDDVVDVTPCTDFIQISCSTQVIHTWNIRTSMLSRNASSEELQTALERTLVNNPFMLSFMVVDPARLGAEQGLYATIRANKMPDQCIIDNGTVNSLEDLREMTMNYPFPNHTFLPGPLFRAIVVFVREANAAALITNISHSLLDAVYHRLFNEDIDHALGGSPLQPHMPFKTFADAYYALRKSPKAKATVRFHVEYLRELRQHYHVLWPHPTPRLTVAPERQKEDGHVTTFVAPSFVRLRDKFPNLTAPIVLKAALALTVVSHTKHTHSVFLNFEANRTRYPFLPASIASQASLQETSDIAGPAFGAVINLIRHNPEETVLDYLTRIQRTQVLLTEHGNVPWYEIFRRLDLPAHDILPTIAESLILNWMPGLGAAVLGENPFQHMTVLQTHIRTKMGMLVNASATGPDGSHIVLLLQGALANMSTREISRVADEIKRISLWLADEETWSMRVGQFWDCLKD
ncbi:hypothetical protein BDV25DRAFT_139749 [Aspergillus avenaceus]|uniref:Carrier domain-containing protein n=1 Tax=Aspergillus avenaceus TaxID=36643 RepID=A0A5N6TW92_ASPAV|nr:hypothetical protein BDV25DRAFT_139749 [Aspergillus avenaceus]